jgi:ferredoxin
MSVRIEDGCILCGACEAVCDSVFKLEDAVVVNQAAAADNADCVKEAVAACPVGVIVVE